MSKPVTLTFRETAPEQLDLYADGERVCYVDDATIIIVDFDKKEVKIA